MFVTENLSFGDASTLQHTLNQTAFSGSYLAVLAIVLLAGFLFLRAWRKHKTAGISFYLIPFCVMLALSPVAGCNLFLLLNGKSPEKVILKNIFQNQNGNVLLTLAEQNGENNIDKPEQILNRLQFNAGHEFSLLVKEESGTTTYEDHSARQIIISLQHASGLSWSLKKIEYSYRNGVNSDYREKLNAAEKEYFDFVGQLQKRMPFLKSNTDQKNLAFSVLANSENTERTETSELESQSPKSSTLNRIESWKSVQVSKVPAKNNFDVLENGNDLLIEGNSDSQITVTMLMIYSLVFLVIGILLASGSYYNRKSMKDSILIFLILFAFALTSWLLRGYFDSHVGKIQFGFQGDNMVYQVTDGEKNEKRKQALPITSINSMVYQVGESAFSVSKMLRPAPGVKLEDTVDWSRENTITINFEFLSQFERIVVYLALHNHIEKIKLEQCSKKRNCAGATGSWSSN